MMNVLNNLFLGDIEILGLLLFASALVAITVGLRALTGTAEDEGAGDGKPEK